MRYIKSEEVVFKNTVLSENSTRIYLIVDRSHLSEEKKIQFNCNLNLNLNLKNLK